MWETLLLREMKENEFESSDEKRIDREAAEWASRKMGGFSPREQDEFFDWLAADPLHGEWYERHRKTWQRMDLLAEWLPEHSDKPSQDLLRHHYPRFHWGWLSAAAALIALSLILLYSLTGPDGADYMATNLVAYAYESHELPDGSVVELNHGAVIKINYSKEFRSVELISSEAHFTVAKDPSRPFIARVRGVDIRAVGTAFNVRLTDQSVQVIVTEGRVEVAAATVEDIYENTPIPQDRPTFTRELFVGQMTEVPIPGHLSKVEKVADAQVKEVSMIEMDHYLAWKPQMFKFDSTLLSEVVEEFNRRNKTHIVIADANLGGLPIVASFRSANVEHFLELLQLSMDLEIERDGKERIVLHSSQ